jgi:hypothetical protein
VFEWGRLFTLSPLKLRESANKRREARFMVLTVEPCPVPSQERSFHGKVKEASVRVGFKTCASNSLFIGSARLIFQEKINS